MPMFRRSFLVLFILVIATLIGTIYGYYESNQTIKLAPATEKHQQETRSITVYITGAINKPSLITIVEGARVGDVVNVAGGLLPVADIDRVNMAQLVKDGEHIHIPEKIETHLAGHLNLSDDKMISSDNLININTANEGELSTLPGIGEAMSKRIIEYRENNGAYKKIEDIKKVKGIGEVKFDKIKDKIRV